MNTSIKVLMIALAGVAFVGCKKAVKEDPNAGGGTTVPAETGPTTGGAIDPSTDFTPNGLKTNPCLITRVITFDLDRTEIAAEFDAMLGCHAKFLNMNPSYTATLEGHADERGTREYNLGLGERRGNSVSDMLKAKDAPAGQINVVSYGEERPTCNESSESCWSQNRRVEIVYSTK